jgi:arylformamidase
VALHDVSIPIHPGMIIYRKNPGVELERALAIDGGDGANVSRLTMGVHSGTHIDGSLHFFNDGAGVDALSLDAMLGPCHVVELTDVGDAIDQATLEAASIPAGIERLILKTSNSALWNLEEFTHDFLRLDGSGASFVHEQGIKLIGIDYLSIGDHDAHVELLGNGVVALEGLDLRQISPGPYELICLPMLLVNTDGAPARVLLRDIEPDESENG